MKSLSSLEKYNVILPLLNKETTAKNIEKEFNIPVRTIRYWVKQFSTQGLEGLKRKVRADKGELKVIENELVELTRALALQKPPLLISAIHRKISILAKRSSSTPPSYHTIYNIVKSINPALSTLAIYGGKAYQEKYELIFRRECKTSNEIWQADHTLLDIFILDENGKERRPWFTSIIDDYSRAIAGRYLSFEAPSAINTALALRHAICKKSNPAWEVCGIPQNLYTDHGSDFMSDHIREVCINLKIRTLNSAIGRPQGRGKVERFFNTLNECVLAELPGYSINGKPSSKPTLNLKSLESIFEGFITETYHESIHSSTGEKPKSRWSSNFLPQLPESLDLLDDLLLKIKKERKIQRDGIRFNGLRYISPTLAGFVGELVTLRYDPFDLAEIRVYYKDKFLCRAICQDIAELVVSLKEIKKARNSVKTSRYKTIKTYKRILAQKEPETVVEPIVIEIEVPHVEKLALPKLKLYENE